MEFFDILMKLLPLYLIVLGAYIVGKKAKVNPKAIADMSILYVTPIAILGALLNIEFEISHLVYPVAYTMLQILTALCGLWLARRVFQSQKAAYLMGGSAGQANIGYFGYPVAIALFGPEKAEAYMLVLVGGFFFEVTFVYYLMARGNFSVKESLNKLIKLPIIYALILAFVLRWAGVDGVPQSLESVYGYFRGAYVVLGMSIIGLALAAIDKFSVGPRFLSVGLAIRFVLWPVLTFALVMFDMHVTHFLSADHYGYFALIAVVPFGANIAAYATQLDVYPDKAAMLVLISTVVALIIVPLVFTIFPVQ